MNVESARAEVERMVAVMGEAGADHVLTWYARKLAGAGVVSKLDMAIDELILEVQASMPCSDGVTHATWSEYFETCDQAWHDCLDVLTAHPARKPQYPYPPPCPSCSARAASKASV